MLALKVRQIKAMLRFTSPVIGVHIRHGDSCLDASLSTYRPPCLPTEDYLTQVGDMADR
ncbi:hypothetical protein T484DRAFT_1794110 [Baffinella frigidus]|nr:hypothetical protein T484DRAFT_1794110 [Cryptophyta sp. CCMP2293]